MKAFVNCVCSFVAAIVLVAVGSNIIRHNQQTAVSTGESLPIGTAQASSSSTSVNTGAVPPTATPILTEHELDQAVARSWNEVAKTWPEVGTDGSKSKAFMESVIQDVYKQDPNYFNQPNWPELLTARYANTLGALRSQTPTASESKATHEEAVSASAAKMYKRYPELAKQDSAFGDYYIQVRQATQKQSPQYFDADDWPEKLADECARRWPAIQAQMLQQIEQRTQQMREAKAADDAARSQPSNWVAPEVANAQWQAQQQQQQMQHLSDQIWQLQQQQGRTQIRNP